MMITMFAVIAAITAIMSSQLLLPAASGALLGLGAWLLLRGVRSSNRREESSREDSAGSKRQSFGTTRRFPKTTSRPKNLPIKVAAAAALAGLIYWVTGWPAAAALAGASVVLFAGRLSAAKQTALLAERADAIASWIEMLYSTIIAGGGFEKAIVASARSAPASIRPQVERLAARIEIVPLPQSLTDFAKEMEHPACDKVVMAIILASSQGAQDIVGLLRSQALSVRQEAQLMRTQQAGRAKFLTSARIVVGATLAVAAGIYLFDDGYLAPYGSTFGQLMLCVVGAGFMGGYALLVKMGTPKPTARYFQVSSPSASDRAASSAPSGSHPTAPDSSETYAPSVVAP